MQKTILNNEKQAIMIIPAAQDFSILRNRAKDL